MKKTEQDWDPSSPNVESPRLWARVIAMIMALHNDDDYYYYGDYDDHDDHDDDNDDDNDDV